MTSIRKYLPIGSKPIPEFRVLYLDIENSYMLLAGFGLYDQTFTPAQIIQDWHLISVSWMFEGDKEVSNVIGKGKNDKRIAKKIHKIISQADLIVWHNGDKFDLKKLKARMIKHKLPPLKPVPTVDTLKVARKEFGFSSNRLGYLAQFLGVSEQKGTPRPGLWVDEIKGVKGCAEEMLPYGDQDIRTLRAVYLELRPHMTNHPNLKALKDPFTKKQSEYEFSCDKCQSNRFKKRGKALRSTKSVGQQYQCLECGGYKTV